MTFQKSDNAALKETVNPETGEVTFEQPKPDLKLMAQPGAIEGALVGGNTTGEEIESKADKFIRLADARTRRVINTLRLIGHLGNKGAYDYTPEQVEKIFGTIVVHFENARNKLLGIKEMEKPFSLRD